jgi:hypothetical protein
MEVKMMSPVGTETRRGEVNIVAELLKSPELFDQLANDPVLFEAFAKEIEEQENGDGESFGNLEFTIEVSLKDIVD